MNDKPGRSISDLATIVVLGPICVAAGFVIFILPILMFPAQALAWGVFIGASLIILSWLHGTRLMRALRRVEDRWLHRGYMGDDLKLPESQSTAEIRGARASRAYANEQYPAVPAAEASPPQLEKARVGTFEELFASSTLEVKTIGRKLRELINEAIPEASETVYLGWKIALYRKDVEICGIQPASDRCNFYLARGVFLVDPKGLLEGSGKRLRHVKVRSVVAVADKGIRDLLIQAVRLPVHNEPGGAS